MMRRVMGLLMALALPVSAQSLRSLPRATATTGVNDSALVLVSDSASRTRAASTHELFKRPDGSASKPAFSFALDSTTGLYRAASRALRLQGRILADTTTANAGDTTAYSFVGHPMAGMTLVQNSNALVFRNNAGSNIMQLPATTPQMVFVGSGGASAPSLAFATNDLDMGLYRIGADTLGFSAGGTLSLRFQSTGIFGPNGTASAPTFSWINNNNSGFYLSGGSPTFAVGGTARWQWNTSGHQVPFVDNTYDIGASGAVALRQLYTYGITGGTASLTLLGGQGNDRNLILQSSNASGTATEFARGAGDTLKLAGHALFSGLTAASGTPNSVCIDATTSEITENAASSCLVSSVRFKTNVRPLTMSTARNIVHRLRPVTFQYRANDRSAIGLIAEQAGAVDKRLATVDAQGRTNSINYEQITAALLLVVQEQQRQIAALAVRVDSLARRP